MNTTQIKNDIISTAVSHVFEALQHLASPINVDMDESEVSDLIRTGLDKYHYDGVGVYYEAFLIVGSSEFPDAESVDFTGCESSLDCLMSEANDIAAQTYRDAVSEEIAEVVERIIAISEKAAELGYDGALNMSGSSVYGWAVHNYETPCGIAIYNDERLPHSYNPSLLEGELWAIEGTVNGLHFGACWTPEND